MLDKFSCEKNYVKKVIWFKTYESLNSRHFVTIFRKLTEISYVLNQMTFFETFFAVEFVSTYSFKIMH